MRFITNVFVTIAFLIGMPVVSALAQSTISPSSSVKIVSIAPELSKPLYVGDKVRIMVEVEYVLSQESGTITLVLQTGESGGPFLGNSTDVVFKGKGTVKLEREIQIPDTRAIQVFTPLTPQGVVDTSIVDYRAFKVAKR